MADISYQTEMPTPPDTSRDAYNKAHGAIVNDHYSNAFTWLRTIFGDAPSYQNWKGEQWDQYNAAVQAYNTYLSSGAGLRASAESGGYNPNYFGDTAGMSGTQTAPVGPDEAGTGLSSIATGVDGAARGIMSLLSGAAQLKGLFLSNEQKAIQNKYLEDQLKIRNAYLGFRSDWQQLLNETEIFSRYKDTNFPFGLINYGFGTYNFTPQVGQGNMYQSDRANIDFVKMGTQLRYYNGQVAKFTAEQREFYVKEMQSLDKQLLEGELDWQQYEKQLRADAQKSKIGNETTNTVLKIASFIASIVTGGRIPVMTTEYFDDQGTITGGRRTSGHK